MANTIVRYSATLSQTDFTIPFDYINEDDVHVALNSVALTKPAQWDYVNASTVRLATPCSQGDAVIIQRRTEDTDRLVDFQTGAVLTEPDLDLAHKQTFYLIQEMRDALNDVASAAIVDVTAEQLEAIGQEILAQAVADEIQGRITDIDTAGELLINHMMQLRPLGEPDDTYSAFILDQNTTLVTPTESLAQRFASISATAASNAAAIVSEQVARASADSALASDITTVSTTVDGHTASITTLSASVDGIEAQWGVSLNVNGHITGLTTMNNGSTGSFAILADEFYIVDPANGLGTPTTVFGVAGGVVSMQNAYVAGDLLVDGTITADFEFNGGTIEIPTNGYIFSGSSTFFSTTGWWIGTSAGDPRLFFGDPSGDYIRFQNGVLTIAGGVSFPDGFTSNDDAGSVIGRNDTDADSGGAGATVDVHPFTVRGSGTIAVRVQASDGVYPGGGLISLVSQGTISIVRNNTVVAGPTSVAAAGEYAFTGITVTDPADVFEIRITDAVYNDSGGSGNFQAPVVIDWSEVRARLSHVVYQ